MPMSSMQSILHFLLRVTEWHKLYCHQNSQSCGGMYCCTVTILILCLFNLVSTTFQPVFSEERACEPDTLFCRRAGRSSSATHNNITSLIPDRCCAWLKALLHVQARLLALQRALSCNKYLLIIDDVWPTALLALLGRAPRLLQPESESCLLITSRFAPQLGFLADNCDALKATQDDYGSVLRDVLMSYATHSRGEVETSTSVQVRRCELQIVANDMFIGQQSSHNCSCAQVCARHGSSRKLCASAGIISSNSCIATLQAAVFEAWERCTSPLAAMLLGSLVYSIAHNNERQADGTCSKEHVAAAVLCQVAYWREALKSVASGDHVEQVNALYQAHLQHVCDTAAARIQQGLQCMLSVLRLFPPGCKVPLAAVACAWHAVMQQRLAANDGTASAWQCFNKMDSAGLIDVLRPREHSAFPASTLLSLDCIGEDCKRTPSRASCCTGTSALLHRCTTKCLQKSSVSNNGIEAPLPRGDVCADGLVSLRFHHLLADFLTHTDARLLQAPGAPAAVTEAIAHHASSAGAQTSASTHAAGWQLRLPATMVTLYGRPPASSKDAVATWQLTSAAQAMWYLHAAALLAFDTAAPGAHFAAAAFPVPGSLQSLHEPIATARPASGGNGDNGAGSSATQAATTVLELVVMRTQHGSRPSISELVRAAEALMTVPACVMPTVRLLQTLQASADQAGARAGAQQQHRNLLYSDASSGNALLTPWGAQVPLSASSLQNAMQGLKQLKHLPAVNFAGCLKLCNEHVSNMTALQPRQDVTCLDLAGCTQLQADSLAAVSHVVALQHLAVATDFCKKNDAELLARTVERNSSLHTLYLRSSVLGDQGARELATVLRGMSCLRMLDLGWSQPETSTVAELLEAFAKLSLLQLLDLQDNAIDTRAVSALATALPRLVRLTALILIGNGMGEAAADAMLPALTHLTALQALYLQNNALGAAAAPALAYALPKLARLTLLALNGNGMGQTAAKTMAPALAHVTALQALYLQNNALGAAPDLANVLSELARLTLLNLADNGMGECAATAMLPALTHLTALQALYLRDNALGAAAAPALAGALPKLACLTLLNLANNGMGETSADALLPALAELTMLQYLDLQDNALGAGSAQALANALAQLTRLTALQIANNGIRMGDAMTDVLLPALAHLTALAIDVAQDQSL